MLCTQVGGKQHGTDPSPVYLPSPGAIAFELGPNIVPLMGLAAGPDPRQVSPASHSENWVAFPGRQHRPVKGMTFREARAVPQFGDFAGLGSSAAIRSNYGTSHERYDYTRGLPCRAGSTICARDVTSNEPRVSRTCGTISVATPATRVRRTRRVQALIARGRRSRRRQAHRRVAQPVRGDRGNVDTAYDVIAILIAR